MQNTNVNYIVNKINRTFLSQLAISLPYIDQVIGVYDDCVNPWLVYSLRSQVTTNHSISTAMAIDLYSK